MASFLNPHLNQLSFVEPFHHHQPRTLFKCSATPTPIPTSSNNASVLQQGSSHRSALVPPKPLRLDDVFVDDDDHHHRHEEDRRQLNEIWREIQGSKDWEGILDPMNSHLRREIIRYGEFSQACYDSFDFDPHSKYCGSCKYLAHDFFQRLDMSGYHMCRLPTTPLPTLNITYN